MTGIKISNLPAIASVTGDDLYASVQGGVTYQATIDQLATYFNGALTFLPLAGGAMTGNINMASHALKALSSVQSGAALDALTFTYTAIAVNYLNITNNIAGVDPSFNALGSDSNISIILNSKGTGGIKLKGTGTNDSAAAGYVGQYISSSIVAGSAVPLTTTVSANVTSISLTAGDWDVASSVLFLPDPTTTSTAQHGAISATTGTFPTAGSENNIGGLSIAFGAGGTGQFCVGPTRISLASTTTIYLVASAIFAVSTMAAYGFIGARRIR